MKILNYVLPVFVIILIIMSLIALVSIHMRMFPLPFSFTPDGLETYLDAYGKYATLFGGTVGLTSLYFGLLRADAALDANRDKLRQDRFTEWKAVIDVRLAETDKPDPLMKREFIRLRRRFFNELFSRNFSINNKQELTSIVDNVFGDVIPFFEEMNTRYLEMGGIYRDSKQSYSFDSFRFLFMATLEKLYEGIANDLAELYLSKLPNTRHIGEELYQSALRGRIERNRSKS